MVGRDQHLSISAEFFGCENWGRGYKKYHDRRGLIIFKIGVVVKLENFEPVSVKFLQ